MARTLLQSLRVVLTISMAAVHWLQEGGNMGRNERGFTLTELLVISALVLGAVVMFAR